MFIRVVQQATIGKLFSGGGGNGRGAIAGRGRKRKKNSTKGLLANYLKPTKALSLDVS